MMKYKLLYIVHTCAYIVGTEDVYFSGVYKEKVI